MDQRRYQFFVTCFPHRLVYRKPADFGIKEKLFRPPWFLIPSNSMELKSGLLSCSYIPRNSMVFRLRIQFWMIYSLRFASRCRAISVSELLFVRQLQPAQPRPSPTGGVEGLKYKDSGYHHFSHTSSSIFRNRSFNGSIGDTTFFCWLIRSSKRAILVSRKLFISGIRGPRSFSRPCFFITSNRSMAL